MSTRVVVFAAYFALVFAIGWLSLKRTQSEADYWIAGGKLGWLVGGATIAATHVSVGIFIGTIGVIYTVGWSFTWLVLSIPLAYCQGVADGRIKKGDLVMLEAMGGGITWGAALLRA